MDKAYVGLRLQLLPKKTSWDPLAPSYTKARRKLKMQRHVLCSPSPTYASSFSTLRMQNDKAKITVRKDLILSAEKDIETLNTATKPDMRAYNLQYNVHSKPSTSNNQQPRKNKQKQLSTAAQGQNVYHNLNNLDDISQPSGPDRLCVINSVEGNYKGGLQGVEEEAAGNRMVDSEQPPHNDVISESESDSSTQEFFRDTKTAPERLRLPYTPREDEQILKFVLMGYNIDRTSSISLWKTLETKMTNPTRTYQSLKNRFLRNIQPHIFTKFWHMLDEEARRKVKRKFPGLKKSYKAGLQLKNAAHTKSTDRVLQPVRCPTSHMKEENATHGNIPAGHSGVHQNAKSLLSKEVNTESRVLMDKATNTENMEMNTHNLAKFGETLTFKFSEMIEPIPRNSQSVMNLVFFNHGNNEERSQSLLSKEEPPIKLNIEVTVSAASNVDCVALKKELETSRMRRTKAVEHSRCSHRRRVGRIRNKYVLGLKNCNMASWPKSRKETLQRLMKNLEDIERKRNSTSLLEGAEVQGRVLRSQKRRQALVIASEEASSQANLSDLTNCSTNEDFGSTQLHQEVNKRYRLVMETDSQNSQVDGMEETEKSEPGLMRRDRREGTRGENSSGKENSELQLRGMPPLLGNMLRMTQRISNKIDEAPRSLTKRL